VRVTGRVRCADPIVTPSADRLVALHRDVEVQLPSGGWRTIERLRETRDFELWDHAGALHIDPATAEEPLVVFPHVWHGRPDELGNEYRAAVARLAAEGADPVAARAVTRMVSVIDRLLVLAEIRREPDGVVSLMPPAGGYVISALELADAMRLLGGPRKALLLASAGALGVGILVALAGLALLAWELLLGA
jgi:E3 ubiquitin ligase